MLYNFKFTIVNPDGTIAREDIITAGSAADADFIWQNDKKFWTVKEKSLLTYELNVDNGGTLTRMSQIKIECLGELSKTEGTVTSVPVKRKLYRFNFTSYHRAGSVIRENMIIAESGEKAIHAYSRKLHEIPHRMLNDFEEAFDTNFTQTMIMECIGAADETYAND